MSVKVVLPNGKVEIIANAVDWDSMTPTGHLYLFSDEERKHCVAEFREWTGVKEETEPMAFNHALSPREQAMVASGRSVEDVLAETRRKHAG